MKLAAWFAGGSALVDAIRNLLGFKTAGEIATLLAMEFADAASLMPTRTTLADGVLSAGPVLSVAYNQFADFDPFSYDWRSDVRCSGQLLWSHLRDNKPEAGKWKLVSHSQGGLVVSAAARACAKERGDSDTAFSDF